MAGGAVCLNGGFAAIFASRAHGAREAFF
ncbi:hypothetical protein M218_15035 [Burkholderia pseudomallei MSHR338]|nr:hypothetical protein M218_15035 [Burkholderia pseudomallei MSHR338]